MRGTKRADESNEANGSKVVVDSSITRKNNWRRWFPLLALLVLLVVGAGGGALWYYHNQRIEKNNKAVAAAELHTLQTSLSFALTQNDFNSVITAASQLISGASAHTFTFGNDTLAQYYLDRATAYINLKQYVKAIPDCQKAGSVSQSSKEAALQAEVQARYSMGQRKQLIPLFQQLANLAQGSLDQRAGTPGMYQQYIQEIQHNQELQLP